MLQGTVFEKIFYIILFLNIAIGVLITVNDIRDITQQNMTSQQVNTEPTEKYFVYLSESFEDFYNKTLNAQDETSFVSDVSSLSALKDSDFTSVSGLGDVLVSLLSFYIPIFGLISNVGTFVVSGYYSIIAIPVVILYNILINTPFIFNLVTLFFKVVFGVILFDPNTYVGNTIIYTASSANVLLSTFLGMFKIISAMAYVYMFYIILNYWKLTNIQNLFDVVGSMGSVTAMYIKLYTWPVEVVLSIIMPILQNLANWVNSIIPF